MQNSSIKPKSFLLKSEVGSNGEERRQKNKGIY